MVYYRQYQPGAELAEHVECYWVFRASGDSCKTERLIPGGRVEMIFHFGSPFELVTHSDAPSGDVSARIHFMGQRDKIHFGRPLGADVDMLGVRFKPGGLAAFTTLPLSECLNRLIPAEDVLGVVLKGWEDRLFALREDIDKILLLDRLLSGLLRRHAAHRMRGEPSSFKQVLAMIRSHPDDGSVQEICRQTGWYYKKLERNFKTTVGYTPKQYCGIIRFNKAIRQIGKPLHVSLTKVGYACGYYDQSHFIRDFSRYAGIVPGDFQTGEHVMVDCLVRHQPV